MMRAFADNGILSTFARRRASIAAVTQAHHDGFEPCVLCRCITDVRVDEPTMQRQYYMDGAGQLCPECFKSVML